MERYCQKAFFGALSKSLENIHSCLILNMRSSEGWFLGYWDLFYN